MKSGAVFKSPFVRNGVQEPLCLFDPGYHLSANLQSMRLHWDKVIGMIKMEVHCNAYACSRSVMAMHTREFYPSPHGPLPII